MGEHGDRERVAMKPVAPATATMGAQLRDGHLLRIAGAHDGLSAILAERAQFDAVWASGFGISAAQGLPDASILTMTEVLSAASIMTRSLSIPVIVDCDAGFGDVNVVRFMVSRFESAGVAAVCIEDKEHPKRNSFRAGQQLADVTEFSLKIKAAKDAQQTDGFLVIARLESFIASAGLEDAILRAHRYADHGADAILVHSKSSRPDEILSFAERWHGDGSRLPLLVVPTTYPVAESLLADAGLAGVIYANQALRAAYSAIQTTLAAIHETATSRNVEDQIAPVSDVLDLVGMQEVERVDNWFTQAVESARTSDAQGHNGRGPALSATSERSV
jgi:phosphoenolpyruvate phosphomutase